MRPEPRGEGPGVRDYAGGAPRRGTRRTGAARALAMVILSAAAIPPATMNCATRDPAEQALYFHDKGDLAANVGRYAEAEPHYRRALAIEPGRVLAWNALAVCLRAQARFAQALAAHDRALALRPGDPKLVRERDRTAAAARVPPHPPRP